MEYFTWCDHRLRYETWSAMSEDESEQNDLLARAYDDAEHHHLLYQPRLQHSHNVGDHRLPGTRHTVDIYDGSVRILRLLLARMPHLPTSTRRYSRVFSIVPWTTSAMPSTQNVP